MIGDDEHRVALARLADQHRPGAVVLAASAALAQRSRRVGERDEARRPRRAAPCGSSRTSAAAPPRGRRRRTASCSRSAPSTATRPSPSGSAPTSTAPAQRPPAPHERARRARPVAQLLARSPPARDRRPRRAPRLAQRDLALGRLVPGDVPLAVDGQLVDRLEPVRAARDVALDHVQEPHAHVDRASAPPSSRHSRLHQRTRSSGMRARCAPRG